MHSLFSRSRTFSTPQKKSSLAPEDTLDEFGRVSGRQTPTTGPWKKDKKKGRDNAKRSGTLPNPGLDSDVAAQFPDGTFLPLNLERPKSEPPEAPAAGQHPHAPPPPPPKEKDTDYGYLCFERHVVLGLDQLERLVDVVANELETRGGMTTPFIFNNSALDINPSGIKRLIHSFIDSCAAQTDREAQAADLKWKDEARFAGPHELGMCLRWGLARVIRSVGGQDVRGLVSWEHYCEWRESEAAMQYPPAHFQMFLPELPAPLQFIIVRILSLLARLVANSTSSGHTPPTLSPLFGPLFFGLGPPTLAFHHVYMHYLRAANAMEHIILAFIRWQDAPRGSSGSASALGVPVRLKEWIKGYPANLVFLQNPKAKPQPRKGSRTVRVVSVRRNVRMYSADLVKSASTWGQKSQNSQIHNSFALSKEWDRIAPSSLKLPPRYSDAYKKKMNMPNSFHPDVAPGTYTSAHASPLETAPSLSLSSTLSSVDSNASDYFGLSPSKTDRATEKFRSLTDMKWGEFEDMGFDNNKTEEKLRFDLTESARQERKSKRQTLDWNDFSSSGFSRMDAPLSATLQFSTPVISTVSAWPAQQAEIHKKLKKQQKSLPSFGWDTEPVLGSEEVIEATFLDAFIDLIYGGGWMDLERGESVDRDCNWALVEYKSLPPSRSTVSGGSDPRTDATIILFEEFVPLEYRQQLALPPKSRRRLPSLFSPSKQKQWKQAATLNGRPYVVGAVPASPSFREVEFEGMLARHTGTKQISLSKLNNRAQTTTPLTPVQDLSIPPPPSRPAPKLDTRSSRTPEPHSRSDDLPSDLSGQVFTPSKKSRFRIPVPSPNARRSMLVPSEYSTIEFQTRMASYSDDEHNGDADEPEEAKQKRRESQSDAWVDILVSTQNRRMDAQAAAAPGERRGRHLKSDPESASLEVAQVLAAVKDRSRSPSSIPTRVDYSDYDVDEVETVPRNTISDMDDAGTSESEVHLAYERTEEGGDEEVDDVLGSILNTRQMAREQRRMGYFDLHPERRPMSTTEDPRARFGRDDSDSEGEGDLSDGQRYGQAEPRRPLRALPVPPQAVNEPPAAPAPAPTPAPAPVAKRSVPEIKVTTKPSPAPATPTNGPAATSTEGATTPTRGSKTAALIEMYRERERTGSVPQTSNPVSVAPLNVVSRLPVRSASLPVKDKEAAATPTPTPSPAVAAPVASVKPPAPAIPSPPKVTPQRTPSPPEPEALDVPGPGFVVAKEDPGRISPARYVHGAPLHNVIEEEEEEE